MRFDAVIFDLDETLVLERPAADAAWLDTCAVAGRQHGICPQAFLATARATCRRIWHTAPAREYCVLIGVSSTEGLWATFEGPGEELRLLREWAPEYRINSWHEALREYGIDDSAFAGQLALHFQEFRQSRQGTYDDARPVLEQVKKTHTLALLTNGLPDLQHRKIEMSGLAYYFDAVVVSGDVGFGKPDARVFEAVLSRLGVSAEAALMIGDSLGNDVRGAQTTGMKAAWINRLGKPREDSIVPDYSICSLLELPGILSDTSLPSCV